MPTGGIVRQVDRRECLVELLLQNRCVLLGLDKPFAELATAFDKQLLVSFEIPGSFDGQFRFGFDP